MSLAEEAVEEDASAGTLSRVRHGASAIQRAASSEYGRTDEIGAGLS